MIPSLPRPAWLRTATTVYLVAFMAFLFMPLIVVAVFSFNDAPYPAPPWRGFTLLVWLVPIALLLGGVVLLFFTLRDWHALAPGVAIESTLQGEEDRALANIDEAELKRYRTQLEKELAADDALFERYRKEA